MYGNEEQAVMSRNECGGDISAVVVVTGINGLVFFRHCCLGVGCWWVRPPLLLLIPFFLLLFFSLQTTFKLYFLLLLLLHITRFMICVLTCIISRPSHETQRTCVTTTAIFYFHGARVHTSLFVIVCFLFVCFFSGI